MKKLISAALLAGLAAVAFAQSNQVDAVVAFQAPDLNAAKVNVIAAGDQKSKKAPNVESTVKYTFVAKLDDVNTVKAGASVDLYTPFFVGNADPYKTQLAAKVIEPFVQYQGMGIDAMTSFAVYTSSPSDTSSGSGALGFYTGPQFSATKAYKDNAFPTSNYINASYKFSVDKTLAFIGGVETDLGVTPVLFLQDLKPRASVIWTVVQLDAKYNLTYKTTNADDSSKTYTYQYVEPKLTGDLKDVVAGLKLYTGGKFLLSTSNGDKLKGSRWDNGAVYSFTVKDVGTFAFDSYVRVGGIGPDDVADNTQIDFNLKATYTLKF
jgi:hypothetical protein